MCQGSWVGNTAQPATTPPAVLWITYYIDRASCFHGRAPREWCGVRYGLDRDRVRMLATQGALDLLRKTLLKAEE